MLNAGMVGGNGKAGSATVEFLSTYFGPVRFGLGSVIAAKDTTTSTGTETAQRLIAGGGTVVGALTFVGPMAVWRNSTYIMLLANPRLGFDMPALGSTTSASTADYDLGGELRANLADSK